MASNQLPEAWKPTDVILQPTMSRSALLLECQWPFMRKVPKEAPGEAAVYGTAFHKFTAFDLNRRGRRHSGVNYTDPVESAAAQHAHQSAFKLMKWLDGDNPLKIKWKIRAIEQSIAWSTRTGKTREISPPDENHVYQDAKVGEIAGTIDLTAEAPRAVLILDHKTGREVDSPLESAQLLTIGVAMQYKPRIVLGIHHAPRDGAESTIYSDVVDHETLEKHSAKMIAAHHRIGDGSMRPGPHCRHCPARLICPTQTSALAELKAKPNALYTSERVGSIHQALETYEDLSKRLREEIKTWVRENGPAVRPDGKIVDFEERGFTNFSMASIIRALGPIEGGKVLEMLEKKGAIERGKRKELRAQTERGR